MNRSHVLSQYDYDILNTSYPWWMWNVTDDFGYNGTKFGEGPRFGDEDYEDEPYIFDRTDVRVIFITLYMLVFCCCFFGNLMVILVVTLSRRLRSITNFFLANLAVADLCVGIFCVLQNLSIYLIPSWVLGDFLCKMYQFVHSLSYTASIFILVVICTERYFAIIHPITCKQILTPTRLRLVIVAVWITSAAYSSPKFIWVQTITNVLPDGRSETICIQHRKRYNAELFDVVNFALLYVTPLCVMTVLYTRIAVGLWRSSRGLQRPAAYGTQPTAAAYTMSASSQNVLRARRGVIRMLIAVVLAFALCNLPLHARKMWQHWSADYKGDSDFSTLFTPLTFLVSYFNSGVNPLLYAFLSRNFRKGMREVLFCSCGTSRNRNKNGCGTSSQRLLHAHRALSRRATPQTSSFALRSCTTKHPNCTSLTNIDDGCDS
ncbi:trissin receptor [Ctenocephalides felis]|uniref:trissin receptor n=1 Tax=Ctenocephalides felis TaxID=7515 RepID=UPI000E6E3A1A|nr:trissin receptor [Ctenocephalides felis]